MPEFKPNVPVVQTDPLVRVDVDKNKPLPPGRYRFELVVVDDAGNESEPAQIDVIVKDTQRPTAVLDMVNADKVVIKPLISVGEPVQWTYRVSNTGNVPLVWTVDDDREGPLLCPC